MRTLRGSLIALLLLAVPRSTLAGIPGAIGILGDSYSDEYQFYPPDRTKARNWVEILAALRGLDFGAFSLASRGEPRNQGFAYNWARSDASTDDLIAAGQHTGLSAQVARGEVGLVMVSIGGNDFIRALQSPDPRGALERMLPRTLSNYRVAVETILAARDDVKVVLATLSDIRNLPEFAAPIRSGRLSAAIADEYTAAIARFNAQIKAIAARDPRITILDLDMATKVANLFSRDRIIIAGLPLDRTQPSNRLDAFFLADSRHPGTMGQGLLAKMFVETINQRFGAGIPPLSETEVLAFARSPSTPAPRGPDRQVAGLEALSGDRPPPATVLPSNSR
jgi:phospholipase/lecithinase/hemolysin